MRNVFLLLLLLAAPGLTEAASFKVVPLFVLLDADQARAQLTVVNEETDKLTVQLRLMKWSQDAMGRDVYEPSKDLVFYPQILTIEGKKEKLVRVGYEGAPPPGPERTYRLFIQELPVVKPGQNVLQIALRLAIPVFLSPRNPKPILSVERAAVEQGTLQVLVKNAGNNHAMIQRVKVTGRDAQKGEVFTRESSGWYVLPGAVRPFPVDLPREDYKDTVALDVVLTMTDGTVDGQVPADPAWGAVLATAEERKRTEEPRAPAEQNH